MNLGSAGSTAIAVAGRDDCWQEQIHLCSWFALIPAVRAIPEIDTPGFRYDSISIQLADPIEGTLAPRPSTDHLQGGEMYSHQSSWLRPQYVVADAIVRLFS